MDSAYFPSHCSWARALGRQAQLQRHGCLIVGFARSNASTCTSPSSRTRRASFRSRFMAMRFANAQARRVPAPADVRGLLRPSVDSARASASARSRFDAPPAPATGLELLGSPCTQREPAQPFDHIEPHGRRTLRGRAQAGPDSAARLRRDRAAASARAARTSRRSYTSKQHVARQRAHSVNRCSAWHVACSRARRARERRDRHRKQRSRQLRCAVTANRWRAKNLPAT